MDGSSTFFFAAEIWNMIFDNVQDWETQEDLKYAWISLPVVSRAFKATIEAIFNERHGNMIKLHFEVGTYPWIPN